MKGSEVEDRINTAEGAAGRIVVSGGAEYLFFSGTSYLGMHVNEIFRQLLLEGLEKYGSAYGSSRASNLQLAIYEEAEQRLAGWLGSEACVLLSSGFMAGQLVAGWFDASGWRLHYAPAVHPALIAGGGRNDVHSGDTVRPGDTAYRGSSAQPRGSLFSREEWTEDLLRELNTSAGGKHVVFACSIDPLHSLKYDFSFLEKISPGKEVSLVVDDSHGFGVFGEEGQGLSAAFPRNIEVIVLGSLGKGLALPCGGVWASAARTKQLRESALFIGASPPAPAYLYAFLKAGKLYREAMARLRENIMYFESLVQELGAIRHSPGLPVFFLEDDSIAGRLMEQGIFLSSFPYPEADSKPVSRVVLSSLHTRSDLEKLAEALKVYLSD